MKFDVLCLTKYLILDEFIGSIVVASISMTMSLGHKQANQTNSAVNIEFR